MQFQRLVEHIHARLRELKKTERQASIEATGKPDAIRTIRRGNAPKPATISALARVLKMDQNILLALSTPAHDGPETKSTMPPHAQFPNAYPIGGDPGPGERDLPVYASAQGGPSGMLVTPDPVDWISRPSPLQRVGNGFAVYIVGDSMDPAYRHGDMAYVNPALPAARGEDVLIYKVVDGEWAAMIKVLTGWNEKSWKLKQYNPVKEFSVARAEWPKVNVIVGRQNRR